MTRTLLAVMLTAGGLLAVLSSPALASAPGAVHGKVTTAGVADKGLKVELMHSSGQDDIEFPSSDFKVIASDNTNTDGTYSFTGLKTEDNELYGLRISDPKGLHATFYQQFSPKAGKTRTVDISVPAAGILAGKVLRADGASPVKLRALVGGGPAINNDDNLTTFTYVPVGVDGSFQFRGLVPSGDTPEHEYVVEFEDDSGKYLPQCYHDDVLTTPGADCSAAAAKISVQAGSTTTLGAETLGHLAGHINGTVTDTFGHPLKGIDVTAKSLSGDGSWHAPTRSTSRFSIGGLPAGQYKVSITDPTNIWAHEWYDNTTMTPAHVFDLADGETITGVNVQLRSKSEIRAKATGGVGTATIVVSVTRRASSSRPSGTVTVTYGSTSKTAMLSRGVATVTFTGIPAGLRKFAISYSGAGSTAPSTKSAVPVTVK